MIAIISAFLVACGVASAHLAAAQVPAGGTTNMQEVAGLREQLIAEVAAEVPMNEWELTASKDGERLAWREKRGKRWVVLVNGKQVGGEFDEVAALQFGPDGKRFAFSAKNGKGWTNVIDGVEQGGPYKKVGSVLFSPDGSRSSFWAKTSDGGLYVVDGKSQALHKDVLRGKFSPDNLHFAYTAQKGKQWFVVVDGVEGPGYGEAESPHYREKALTMAYVARRQKTWFLVDDGKETLARDLKYGYRLLGFTPVAEEPVLEVYDGNQSKMLIGKLEGPRGNTTLIPFSQSDDHTHVAYATATIRTPAMALTERAFGQVVLDGKGGREYEGAPVESGGKGALRAAFLNEAIQMKRGLVSKFTARTHGVSAPSMTRDGRHVAYAARRGNNDMTVVVDGKEGPGFEEIPGEPVYSPDGKLYYLVVDAGKLVLMVDGQRVKETEWREKSTCIPFSFAEGGHYHYGVLHHAEGVQVIADGQEHRLRPLAVLGIPGNPSQVVGGRLHFAYFGMAVQPKQEAVLIVDGKEAKVYSDVWPETVRWSGEGVLTYVARDGQRLLRVTQTVQ